MAEFERICKEWKRMHETVPNCSDCPLSLLNNETAKTCYEFVRDFPVIAEEIIMKWAEDHPVKALPSAQKKGHWIDEGTNYACSECHRGCWVNSNYCPWCGADMRGEDDE